MIKSHTFAPIFWRNSMNTKGTLIIAILLVVSITVAGCGKLNQEEFEMWKNEHVTMVNESNTEIKSQVTNLEGRIDQHEKDVMEAVSKAKDEAIAASQQGDADTIAAGNQNTKEQNAKLRASLTENIEMQAKKSMDFAKAEDAKVQKMVMDNSKELKALGMKVQKFITQVASNTTGLSELKTEVASKPSLLVTVNFGSGQTGLSTKGKEMLDGIVSQILENPDAHIIVVGHADGTPVLKGGFRSNWDLSQARANSAAKYIKSKGIDSERIKAVGKAHTDPVGPQNTAAGRAMNRRVEVILNPTGSSM